MGLVSLRVRNLVTSLRHASHPLLFACWRVSVSGLWRPGIVTSSPGPTSGSIRESCVPIFCRICLNTGRGEVCIVAR